MAEKVELALLLLGIFVTTGAIAYLLLSHLDERYEKELKRHLPFLFEDDK